MIEEGIDVQQENKFKETQKEVIASFKEVIEDTKVPAQIYKKWILAISIILVVGIALTLIVFIN